jgi:polyferredoxin
MGIDIRDGQQLECITCALCIDACDGVMDKIGLERGLIHYATLREYNANMALATDNGTTAINPRRIRDENGRFSDKVRHFDWRVIFRLRTLIYFAAWSAVGVALLVALVSRDRLELNVLKDRNPQYVLESDGSIRNGYTVKILNMIPERRHLTLSLDGLPAATMRVPTIGEAEGRSFTLEADPDQTIPLKVFVTVPADRLGTDDADFRILIEDKAGHEKDAVETSFSAPEAK